MKKILILIVVCCVGFSGSSQDPTAQIDTLLNAYSRLHKFNGSALVSRNGVILVNKGYGYRNATTKALNDSQTIFQIGSVTKQFTTAIILKLQDENKINLQDKISKYFPQYAKGDSITVEQLMLHTSGIFSYTEDSDFMTKEVSNPANKEKMMALFKDKPLKFSPGTDWQYSNSAYVLLGYIIESVTGKPYEQVVRDYIFTPLKMTHSGFDFAQLRSNEKAKGYFLLNDKDSVASPLVDSSVSYAAGAIYSTTGDLHRWHKALQAYVILSRDQQQKAYTPGKNKYGYGWTIDTIEGKRVVAHGGAIHGFTSHFSRIPEDDLCVVLISNSSSSALNDITKRIYAILYKKPYEIPKARIAITLPEEKLREYIGTYEINPGLKLQISVKEGQLIAEPTGQPVAILYAEKEDYFFVTQPEVQLLFKRNDKQEIEAFVLFQGGREVTCKKIN
jgi:CubicO group peptidase (beta-lactamase class C family)